MKSKKVLITAMVVVIFLTALLFVIVFSMQNARAEQTVPLEEAAEELPTEAVTEESSEAAELPEKAAEADIAEEQPAELPEEAEEQPEELSVGTEEEVAETEETPTAETFNEEVKIGCYTQSQKKITLKEAVSPNWEGAEPSAADISKELALCIAEQAAKDIFEWENPKWAAIEFEKDKTGQRGDYWEVQFGEAELIVRVDALSGKVASAYSETRRSNEDTKTHRSVNDPFYKTDSQIWTEEETEQGGEYTAATRAIVEKYIDGKVEKYMLNAVHDAGKCYPLVSIDVLMEDGAVYEFEWARCGKNGELKICSMDSFPSWDHFVAWAYWDADLILNNSFR